MANSNDNKTKTPAKAQTVAVQLELKADSEGLTAYHLCAYNTETGALIFSLKQARSIFNQLKNQGVPVVNV